MAGTNVEAGMKIIKDGLVIMWLSEFVPGNIAIPDSRGLHFIHPFKNRPWLGYVLMAG